MSSNKPSKSTIQLRAIRKRIGENINHYRTAKGISLRKLGLEAHISINNLDLFESGRGNLQLQHIARIANSMEIGIINLLN